MEFNFKNKFVKSGHKVQDESAPIVTLTSTFNVFKLNNKAMSALGVAPEERVVMFDFGADAVDENSRFFICKSFEVDGVEVGAKITSQRQFSYSGIYGAMLLNDGKTENITAETLAGKDLVYTKPKDKKSSYISKHIVNGTLEVVADGEEQQVADGVYRKMYAITNLIFKDHTLQTEEPMDEELANTVE